jgi:hypothetical protein
MHAGDLPNVFSGPLPGDVECQHRTVPEMGDIQSLRLRAHVGIVHAGRATRKRDIPHGLENYAVVTAVAGTEVKRIPAIDATRIPKIPIFITSLQNFIVVCSTIR